MPFIYRGKKSGKKTNRKRAYKKVYKKNRAFVKAVQAIIHKDAESKQAYASINAVAFNSAMNSAGDPQWLIPQIAQGSADNARIGDQIRGQKITVKGAIVSNLTYQSYSNCRLAVRMMIVQPKAYPSLSIAQANATTWLNYLLKKGGTTSAFNGNMADIWAPVNTDAITKYYDKVFYINTPYVSTSVGDLSTYNSVKMFSKTIKLRNKLLKYDSGIDSGLTPTNYAPILLLGYAHLDGSGADVLTTQVSLSMDTIFDYEDV